MESAKSHCEICKVDVSSVHYSRHFKTKKHLQNQELNFIEINKLTIGQEKIIFIIMIF